MKSRTKEYKTWEQIKQRCYNPKNPGYGNYGGRGIVVCNRWVNSFDNFLADMGKRPEGSSLDRINNNGNYEPSNCRWATRKEQANNTRRCKFIESNGQTKTMTEWARIIGIHPETMFRRMRKNVPMERILSKNRLYGKRWRKREKIPTPYPIGYLFTGGQLI